MVQPAPAGADDNFASLFEFLPIGAYRSSPEGPQLRSNPALVRLNGFDSEAEHVAAVSDIGTAWYVDQGRRAEFRCRPETDGAVSAFESEIYRFKTRERIWIGENAHAVRDASGRVRFYEGTVEDNSVRKGAAAELAEQGALWKQALESSGDAVWDWDIPNDREVLCERCARLYGYEVDELPSTPQGLDGLAHPDDVPQMLADRRRHLEGDSVVYENEHRMRCRDGQWKWILSRGMVLDRDAQGRPQRMIGTHTDITARKQAQALRAERDEAAAGDRAKSQFLSRVSHELRTPLNAVLGFAQLLQLDGGIGPRQRGWVRQIIASGRHLMALMDDVLDLSSVQTGQLQMHPEPLRLRPLVLDAWSMLAASAAEADVAFVDALPADGGPVVSADRQRLRQVLLNLLSNAIKYNRPAAWCGSASNPWTAPSPCAWKTPATAWTRSRWRACSPRSSASGPSGPPSPAPASAWR